MNKMDKSGKRKIHIIHNDHKAADKYKSDLVLSGLLIGFILGIVAGIVGTTILLAFLQ